MRNILGKLISLFCIIVFVTFMSNHGHIDYRGIDFVRTKTSEAMNSTEGKQYIQEIKEISRDVFQKLLGGLKFFFSDDVESSNLDDATLLSCVDGDTIVVSIDGETTTIRLIGIDAPESVHPEDERNSIYGDMASDFVKAYLNNVETVYLEYDQEQEDLYGRTLAYVWLLDNTDNPEKDMLNAQIILSGYATDASFPPNTKYDKLFSKLKSDAQINETGLWKYPEYGASQ